ncbi:ROK family transcriptional regulator [Streptomyces sp. VRA16 Mangrove soil]|uniref:ROK family transcriptional regulator n=1 Tax=Streptomyces sp. VRA16 Mangrove soil TaxID=2817434 RepID=UPI001A9CE005|nr:ROK family transcriptional regulator [Streptomyces sp. VRA16 Mangrove soil]MBO1331860.1 ROK family transcriptional regulator [Streptomyces sp. VRA16 Mangrove soil]
MTTPPVWNRQRLRSNNEWLLLERLRTSGPASRAQLARASGLSKPTVSSALAALERAGLVREAGTHAQSRGRIAVLYEPDPRAGHVLGIDIGRARLRTAVADLSGTVVARTEVRNRGRSATGVADTAVGCAQQALAEAELTAPDIVHTAVGTPGVFDRHTGRVRYAVNLPGWGRPGLVERMRERLGTPLSVHNDANLAALGEYTFGAGAGSRLFVYVLVGTGLGMGIVADGELFLGAHGAAGEIGFLPLDGVARRGNLEDAVSAAAVVRAARERGMTGPLTAKRVFDAARAGDAAARDAVRQEGERLALAVATVAAVLDPDLVVIGGGVGRGADLLLATVEDALHRLTPLRPRVAAGRAGEDAVLLGALTTALRVARPLVFDRRTEYS